MKKDLRKKILKVRDQMTCNEVTLISKKIIRNIQRELKLDDYQVIGMYMPIGNEVDLRPLITSLIENNKTVVIPKVLSKEKMEFYPIESVNDIHEGKFKVLEPNCNKKMPKNEIDIMFIPGIGFSKQGYRLGFGAGYYDRYLVGYINQKVGVCFAFQLLSDFQTDRFDIPMDKVITENPLHQYHGED